MATPLTDAGLAKLRARLEEVARELGFDQVGVAGTDLSADEARLRRWLRVVLGARAQWIDVNVDDRGEDLEAAGNRSSGARGQMQLLPKLTAIKSRVEDGLLFLARVVS